MSASLAAASPWIQALGWTLLHFVWQGIVIGVAYAGVRALLPRRACDARYAIGLLALLALLVSPLLTITTLLAELGNAATATAGVAAFDAGAVPAAADWTLPAVFDETLPWLVAAWGAGVLLMFARAVRDWRALTRIARRWAEPCAELDAMLQALSARFGFLRRVRVLVSARVDTPMLIGWLRPIVLLPAAVALRFPREQLELILAHELGHLRRYDPLTNLAQAVVETLLFYHPVVHWISRDVRNERELCCDELVLRVTAGQRRDYAHTLASLEELRHDTTRLALAASGGQLVERVRRIAGIPADRSSVGADGPGRWLLAVAALCVAVFAVQRVDRSDEATVAMTEVPVAWMVRPDLRALPLAAIALPFQRLQLDVAEPLERPLRATISGRAALTTEALPARVRATHAAVTTAAADQAQPPAFSAAFTLAPPTKSVATDAVAMAAEAPALAAAPSVSASAVVPSAAPAAAAETAAHEHVAKATPAAVRPVAIRAVAPDFPLTARTPAGRVESSFTIGEDGTLRDIRIADGSGAAFGEAARRALRQWRFDPARLPPDHSVRYAQSFVFAGSPKKKSEHDDCLMSTGSMICRPVADAAYPVTTIYARDETAQASN